MALKHPLQSLARGHTEQGLALRPWKTKERARDQGCPLPLPHARYTGHRCKQGNSLQCPAQPPVQASLPPPSHVTKGKLEARLTWPSENSSRQMAHTGAELQLLLESGHSARALPQLARYLLVASWLMAQAVRC